MKHNLFLLAVSIFAVLHLCKAGPLRLHKRAAFYIANETACVVDNIVYSNGDPIPTDDPCEACKCRPPGFACVLKECRPKPGCRAVRQAGHCCPEYICGCEHNGRMYGDGEEIRDAKNPCYTCHCQGSSIACAFVDCFFRVDCIPQYMPGECCPRYTNCTRDTPDSNTFNEDNALPALNLLPPLNDESILLADFPTTFHEPEPSENPTDTPTQPPIVTYTIEEIFSPEGKESTAEPNDPQTTESESSVTEETKLDPEVEENSAEEERAPIDEKDDEQSTTQSEDKKEAVEVTEEIKALFNSETEIKKDDSTEIITVKVEDPAQPTEEITKEDHQTTVANDGKTESEAYTTEKPSESEPTTTGIPTTEKQVKNSAADNSKSLKLSDDKNTTEEASKDSEKEETKDEEPQKPKDKSDETVTQATTESSSKTESVNTTENKPESEENIAEESQNNHQATFYGNDEKIKSESAETVTIVVHVREKTKLTTETDYVSESVTPESVTSTTQENLLKSNNELKVGSTEISTETTKIEKVTSTGKNFEIFPTSSEINHEESTTNAPLTEEKVEGRSEETDSTTSDAKENPINTENVSDVKNEESTTHNANDVTEISEESRANEEVTEETEKDELKEITIRTEEPNEEIKIKILTDSASEISKIEESTSNESESVETTEGTKSEENEEEIKPEVREADSISEEKVQETTLAEKIEVSATTEKIESSTQTEEIQPEERAAETESEENGEKIDPENVENIKPEESQENKPEPTTESKNQGTEESTQTDFPKENE